MESTNTYLYFMDTKFPFKGFCLQRLNSQEKKCIIEHVACKATTTAQADFLANSDYLM
jgi:hypothetical protein